MFFSVITLWGDVSLTVDKRWTNLILKLQIRVGKVTETGRLVVVICATVVGATSSRGFLYKSEIIYRYKLGKPENHNFVTKYCDEYVCLSVRSHNSTRGPSSG